MKRLLFLLLFMPSALAAQKDQDTLLPQAKRAYSIGILGYTGGTWQPSGLEIAMLWRLGQHVPTTMGATLSLGSFVQDQAVLLSQSQGFFVALGTTIRQPIVEIASVGSERNPGSVRLEASADLAGSADIHSPLPQGAWSARAAVLLGFTFGGTDPLGQSIGVYFGPAALLGRTTSTHGEFVLRFRMPTGR